MHVKTSKKKESTQVGKPNKPEIDQFTFTFFTFYLKKIYKYAIFTFICSKQIWTNFG